MWNWIVWNRTFYMYKIELALNNLQWLMCHKPKYICLPHTHRRTQTGTHPQYLSICLPPSLSLGSYWVMLLSYIYNGYLHYISYRQNTIHTYMCVSGRCVHIIMIIKDCWQYGFYWLSLSLSLSLSLTHTHTHTHTIYPYFIVLG